MAAYTLRIVRGHNEQLGANPQPLLIGGPVHRKRPSGPIGQHTQRKLQPGQPLPPPGLLLAPRLIRHGIDPGLPVFCLHPALVGLQPEPVSPGLRPAARQHIQIHGRGPTLRFHKIQSPADAGGIIRLNRQNLRGAWDALHGHVGDAPLPHRFLPRRS
ncbi:hypothetical protein D3C71_1539850 [compost metagenome]